jgi:hypothetical protein
MHTATEIWSRIADETNIADELEYFTKKTNQVVDYIIQSSTRMTTLSRRNQNGFAGSPQSCNWLRGPVAF